MTDWMRDPVRKHGEAVFADHPAGELLVDFVESRDALTAEQVREVEAHLTLCSACEDDVARLRAVAVAAASASAGAPAPRMETPSFLERIAEWLGGWRAAPAWAVALAVVVWAGASREGADPAPGVRSVGHATVLFAETERGAAPVDAGAAGETVLMFHLPPSGDAAAEGCRVRIGDRSDETVAEIARAEPLDDLGTYLVVLNTRGWEPGVYSLVAEDAAGSRTFGFRLD